MFELRDSGLFYTPTTDSESRFLCGPIQVLGISRGDNGTKDYGLLVEWKNLDGICIRKLIPRRRIMNEKSNFVKELLLDTGLVISSRKGVWEPIISYLIQARPKQRYKSSAQAGWLNNSFVTPSWCVSNGAEKVIYSGNKSITQDDIKNWRLLYLSTGEMGLEEKLAPIQKGVKAGQEIRFLEVPVQRKYGAYDELYSHKTMNDFSDSIWKAVKENHGTIMPKWIEHLSSIDDLSGLLAYRVHELRDKWQISKNNNHGSQVLEAAKRFALFGVAGEIAISAGLMPWPRGFGEHSAKIAFESWLEMRGSTNDSEDEKLLKEIPSALKRWRSKLLPEGQPLNDNFGYALDLDGKQAWFLTRQAFLEGLNIKYKQQISQAVKFMEEKSWMETSEGRDTFKRVVDGGPKGGRYYKVIPHRITEELALDEALSRAALPC